MLGLIQGHRDDQDRLPVIQSALKHGVLKIRLECGPGLRQHASQDLGGGAYTVVLEQVNQFAQPTLIAAVGYGPLKWTDAAAHGAPAQALGIGFRVGRKHTLAANGTHFAADRENARQAIGADGQPRNIQKRFPAKAAIGRKQNGEETLGSLANPAWVRPNIINPDSSETGRSLLQHNRRP